jgi:integrase/recombinase XerD
MPVKLSTTIKKIEDIPNITNQILLTEFHKYLKSNGVSESHQNNNLKALTAFAHFLGPSISFLDIKENDFIISFLDSKLKDTEDDPDKKSVVTWNDYLSRLKYFMRWLHNCRTKDGKENNQLTDPVYWETPSFMQIRKKKTKRLSPYSETEIWDRDEILSIVKYEPYKRNKAALTLLWDLDARNHEITLLKIKHIRLRERYGEGEIPHEAKTGSGPILLTCSFPYVRDWLNEHPLRNEPDARLICNLQTGAPVTPDALWKIMKQLRKRIIHLLENDSINDEQERQKLELLLKTKKWNPYCIRHSSITYDSDYLPEYALKKKVRWYMNSKQGSRYIKRRMGNDLKQKILVQNGIISEQQVEKKPSILNCPRCSLVNAVDNKYCSKCSYPLVPSAFDEIKEAENRKIHAIEEGYKQDIKHMQEEMNQQFGQIMSMIQQNPQLANFKPEVMSKKVLIEEQK